MSLKKFGVYVLFWLAVTIANVLSKSIDCYTCQNVNSKKDCHSVDICRGTNPYCYVTKSTGGNFTLGCANDNSTECEKYTTTTTTMRTTPLPTTTTTPSVTQNVNSSVPSFPNTTLTSNTDTVTSHVNSSFITSPVMSTTPGTVILTSPITETSTIPIGPISAVGRSLQYDDPTETTKTVCCNTDTCNKKLTPAFDNECLDVQSDCQYLNDTFGICGKPHEAQSVCRLTCQLCNYTDGGWSAWGNWSSCDVSCGNGTMTRTRTCTNPAPRDGGLNCTGDGLEIDGCMVRECPKDGNWSVWTTWGSCSATCGYGLRRRDRICSNPKPDPDGLFCLGDSRDDEICAANLACGGGDWSSWDNWSKCSSTCGIGMKLRYRNCSDIYCTGDNQQSELCLNDVMFCEELQWSTWSAWGGCPVTCGMGLRSRERTCANSTSLFAKPCVGDGREFELCKQHRCQDRESAFYVSGAPLEGPTNQSIILPDVITEVGGDYDNTTGIFTCRISGLYDFFVSIEKQADVAQAFCHLLLNETSAFTIRVQSASFGGIGSLQQATNSAVLRLKEGDMVQLGHCSSPETMTAFCTFSGSLVSLE